MLLHSTVSYKKMHKFISCSTLLLLVVLDAHGEHSLSPRVLPTNQNCDPQNEVCRKGDWTAKHIADCERRGFLTCNAKNDVSYSWTVDVAKKDKCRPTTGLRFTCGAAGTDTRCVCSDYKTEFNECRCQYWPAEDPGVSSPAFCTGYYVGGTSKVHHWACCNNCNDPSNTCDGHEWQGGSSEDYCAACGQSTGGGRVKYYFNCGSCDKQKQCADYCSGPIRNLPGLCWQWLDCFKGCCLKNAPQPSRGKRQYNQLSFCGDGTCNSNETPMICPIDCCYQINSVCASNATDLCERTCCGDPTCCQEEAASSAINGLLHSSGFLVAFIILAQVMS